MAQAYAGPLTVDPDDFTLDATHLIVRDDQVRLVLDGESEDAPFHFEGSVPIDQETGQGSVESHYTYGGYKDLYPVTITITKLAETQRTCRIEGTWYEAGEVDDDTDTWAFRGILQRFKQPG